MKKLLIYSIISLSFVAHNMAQYDPKVARIENVDFTFNGKQIVITYDLNSPKPNDLYYVWCEIYNGSHERIEAKSFSGEIWANIKPGKTKKISWDFKSDGVLPTDEIYIKMVAGANYNPSMGGALVKSTVFPGWGASSVSGEKKPLILGYTGYALALGAGALALNASSIYSDYQANPVAADYDKAVMMRNAAIGAAGAAAGIWVVNYFVTANKVKKQRQKEPNYQEYQQENKLLAATSSIKIVDTKSRPEILANAAANDNIFLESDVNDNIPEVGGKQNPNRFALIFGNEDYSSKQTDTKSEINVTFARTDAYYFNEYCMKTLGIPKENIIFEKDATTGVMKKNITKIVKLMNAADDDKAELFFYYAGHGFPDANKDAYLIPTDVTGDAVTEGIKLDNLYRDLTSGNAKRVTVFLDACFSGGGRNAGLMATRGVKITPKQSVITKNLIVFSATSEDQKANPYNEKNHGLFTYFLLKKLQETQGNATYSELADYLKRKVQGQSLRNNSDEQTPEVNVSKDLGATWEDIKLK
jgi:hypothetical protein